MVLNSSKSRRVASTVVTVLFGLGLNIGPAGSSAAVPTGPIALGAGQAATGVVTLITGDQVELSGAATSPRITAAAGRASMPFRVLTDKGHVRVIPADAAAMIAAGRLDERLFDVTTLLEYGYDDARRTELPLIVQTDAAQPLPPGTTKTRPLRSVGGAAVSVTKKRAAAWWKVTASAAGVKKVWLNGRRRLSLDHSAPQIGAPSAWQAGLTGAGVRVAVVDSGIDTSHPDLADRVVASANFTADAAGDAVGHGTHVASTIAGSGAASSGRYRGIAPDARLLDAKVCDAEGYCAEDAILAGMEWAAVTQHAPVVNMSLGGMDTPDVDPLEQAVNTLSAQYGTLFVVAAGNSGPGEGTVESPGSADAALTVGAVDGQDAIAEFSSRGPLAGDGALKPDLTAPGVGIVAARAAGTELGEVVDDQYVRLSGTSMATPHVAGAAADLLQQHPDWSGEQLKAVLMGSARRIDGTGVTDQGAGRVDLAAAITRSVAAVPASMSFGIARWPHKDDQPLSKTITYRNTGASQVTLDLAMQVAGPGGSPTPAGLFTLGADHVVVPAGGSAQVTVTVDTRSDQVPVGRYAGWLVASANGVAVRTPIAVEKESERYDLRIKHVGRDGTAPGSYVTFVDRIGDCGEESACGGVAFGSAGLTTLRLPPGRYTVAEFSTTAGREDMNLLMRPVLDLGHDTALTVDARQARPVRMVAPRASARLMQWDLHVVRDVHRPGQVLDYSVSGDYTTPLYTADLGGLPASNDLLSFVQGRFAEPGPTDDYTDSPYEYEMADTTLDRLFTGLQLRPRQDRFATVQARYAAVTGQPRDVKTEHGAKPTIGRAELRQFGATFATNRLIAKAPFHRTEYYLADELSWTSLMVQGDRESGAIDYLLFDDQRHVYQPGQTYQQSWGQGVFGPHFRQPRFIASNGLANGVMRRGDRFAASVEMFVDSDPYHASEPKVLPGRARLYRDGELLQDWRSFGYLALTLPGEEATYRLEASVTPPVSDISTTVTSAWTFRSGHVDGDQAVALPLLGVIYRPDLDDRNHAQAGPVGIPLELFRQPGAGTAVIASVAVDVSYDEGRTWHTAPLTRNGERWLAAVDNPAGGSVSLRVQAADTDGNRLEQTTIRAYLVG